MGHNSFRSIRREEVKWKAVDSTVNVDLQLSVEGVMGDDIK